MFFYRNRTLPELSGLDDLGTEELALLMGTGNDDAESEEPDVLMAVGPHAEEAMGLQEDQIQALRSLFTGVIRRART